MPPESRHQDSFLTTRWTCVCAAKSDSEDGRKALADLCDAYYEPVVAFLRCELRDADAARDMSHAFFAEMLGGGAIQAVNQERGRFRSYLLGAVKHFSARHRDAQRCLKRGGGATHASLDEEEARAVPDEDQSQPDLIFDRLWATTLLGRALDALQQKCAADGKAALFDKLHPWLTGDADRGDQTALAVELGLNIHTLKSHVSRLRLRFQRLVKEEIAGTLNAGDSVDDELKTLFAALSRR